MRRRLAALAAVALVGTSVPLVAATAASAQEPVACPGLRRAYVVNSGDATVTVIDTTVLPPLEDCKVSIALESGVDGSGATEDAGKAVGGGQVSVEGDEVTASGAPFGVVASPSGDRVYVTHGAGNLVSVIETKHDTVEATISIGDPGDPMVLTETAISPDGARLYVAATPHAGSTGPGRLYPIDTTRIGTPDAVGDPVTVGHSPAGVAVASTPKGERVYVANTADHNVSVVDPSGDDPVVTVSVGNAPTAVAANPVRNEVYVVNSGGETAQQRAERGGTTAGATSSVSVIDTSTNEFTFKPCGGEGSPPDCTSWAGPGTSLFGASSHRATFTDVAVDRSGDNVYVTDARDTDIQLSSRSSSAGRLYRIDPSNFPQWSFRRSTPMGSATTTTGVAASPDGALVYATNTGEGTVSVVEVSGSSLSMKANVPVGAAPTGVVGIAPDPEPLAIITHPASRAVTEGKTGTFSVEATGTQPLYYQWYRNGAAIAGATNASFTTGSVVLQKTEGGQPDYHGARYHVVVTQTATGMTAVSNPATLTVVERPRPVPVGEFKAAPADSDPDAPGFHRLGTMGTHISARPLPPPPMYIDPVNGIGITRGSKPSKPFFSEEEIQQWHDDFHASERCNLTGDALYVYDLWERRATGGSCDHNTVFEGSTFQPLPGVGGRTFFQTRVTGASCLPTDLGPRFLDTRGLAYEIEGGDGAARSVQVRTPELDAGGGVRTLYRVPCPRVGGVPVEYSSRTLAVYSAPSGHDELITLEANNTETTARGLTVCPTFILCPFPDILNKSVAFVARMDERAHESFLVRGFGIPDEPLTDPGDPEHAKAVTVEARWEIDLTALCPSFLEKWVARTDDAVLTYCWDERPPGERLEPPGLSTSAPQGFLVKIPLDADGYPIPRPGTEGLEQHLPGPNDCPPFPTTTTTAAAATTTVVPGCEGTLSQAREPAGPDERGLVYEPGSGGTRVLNATIRRIPTLPGEVTPISDPRSGRVFLLTRDPVNGAAVWVMDPEEERFVGVATSGLSWSEVVAFNEAHPGHRNAVGFNADLGRAYILGPKDILVVDGRKAAVQGVAYPAVGTYGAGNPEDQEVLPDGVDEFPAWSIGGRHYVAIPVVDQGYVVFEDKVVIPEPEDPPDPDGLTTQADEREGETVSTLSGAGEAAGAHVVVAGGVTKTANTSGNPGCHQALKSPFSGGAFFDAAVNTPGQALRLEPKMFDGACLTDVLLASGHREAYLGSSQAQSGTTGVVAHAQGMRVPGSDTATDADLREAGACGANKGRRAATGTFDYTAHAPEGTGRALEQVSKAGWVYPLEKEESWDWVPEDPEERYSKDFHGFPTAALFDGLFGAAYGPVCDGVRDGMLDPAGLDTSEGTDGPEGEGFPAGTKCTDFDPDDGKGDSGEAGGERFGDFSSVVACDGAVPQGTARSSASSLVLPSAKDPLVVVQSATSAIESHRFVENGKAYQVTEARAEAEGVRIGAVTLGTVRTRAVARAGGRTGTTRADLTREWCDVSVGGEILAKGCSIVTGPEDPLVAQVADEVRQVYPKLRISVPQAKVAATPGGYLAEVIKDESLRITDSTVNDDDSITVSALEVVFVNDGAEGRNRWVVQLAGVEAEARYSIVVLPTFSSLSSSGTFTSTKATPSSRRVVPGRKSLPRASTLIEGESFDALLAGSPVPQNPVQRFLQWVPEAVKDLLRLLIQHPLEFALLFLVFTLLATPGYLAYRRRQAAWVLGAT